MEQTNPQKQRQFWVGMGVSVLCLALIFIFIKPSEILAQLKNASYGYLALTGLGIFLFLVIRAVRWQFMLGHQVSWTAVFHIQNIGYMLSNLLPFRAGDVARAVLIGNVPPVTLAQGISTMVVERVLDLLFILVLLPFTVAAVPALPDWMRESARVGQIVTVVAVTVLVVAANQRPLTGRIATAILQKIPKINQYTIAIVQQIDHLLAGLDSLTRLKDGATLVFLSILTWLPILFAYDMGMKAVHMQPTWIMTGFVVCAAAFSVAAPSSPGQIGVFEGGVIAALALFGYDKGVAGGFAFLYHFLNILIMAILGVIGFNSRNISFGSVMASVRASGKRPSTDPEKPNSA